MVVCFKKLISAHAKLYSEYNLFLKPASYSVIHSVVNILIVLWLMEFMKMKRNLIFAVSSVQPSASAQWKLLISLKICLGADFVYMFLRTLFVLIFNTCFAGIRNKMLLYFSSFYYPRSWCWMEGDAKYVTITTPESDDFIRQQQQAIYATRVTFMALYLDFSSHRSSFLARRKITLVGKCK